MTDHPAFPSYETGHASESNSVGAKPSLNGGKLARPRYAGANT